MRVIGILMGAVTLTASTAGAATFRVPEEFAEIQEALDVAQPCDLVEVGDGDYDGPVAVGLG